MKINKRHVSVFLIMCTLINVLCMTPVLAVNEDNAEDTLELMLDLGIYRTSDDMNLENELLTREVAASILSVFYGVTDEVYATTSSFEDVSEYWASGHIMTMVQNGIMSGYSDGLFRPQSNISMEQAVKIFIAMLGREVIAQVKGGYPDGYVQEAHNCDLLDGINYGDGSQSITKGEFTKLLANAITIPIVIQEKYGETSSYSTNHKRTLLTENMDIYNATGRLTNTEYASVNYEGVAGNDEVVIGGITYLCEKDVYEYLALNVDIYYYKPDDASKGRLLHINEIKQDDYITIDADDILDVSNDLLTLHYIKGNRTKVAKLPSDIIVVVNGKRMTYFDKRHLTPEQGRVRLIKGDSGSVYKYAIVDYEIDYRVNRVYSEDSDIYISNKNGKMPVRVNSDGDVYSIILENGKEITVDKLREDDIITVMANSIDLGNEFDTTRKNEVKQDSSSIRILRSTSKVAGTLTQIGDNEIYIDDSPYKLSAMMGTSYIKIGTTYTLYLSYRNMAADIEEDADNSNEIYAILREYSKVLGLNEKLYLKIYTQDAEMLIVESSKRTRIDGKAYKKVDQIISELKDASLYFENIANIAATNVAKLPASSNSIWQPARIMLNDEKQIISIDTLKPNEIVTENDFRLYGATVPGETFIHLGSSANINQKYGFTKETIFFDTTKTAEGKLIDGSYSAYSNITTFTNNSDKIGVMGFDADECGICKMVIFTTDQKLSENITRYERDKAMLFDHIIYRLNDKGEASPYAIGYSLSTGSKISVEMQSEDLLQNPLIKIADYNITNPEQRGSKVEFGDFIRWAVDEEGKVSLIQKYIDANNNSESQNAAFINYSTQGTTGGYNVTVRGSYGTIVAKSDSHILTRFSNGVLEPRPLSGIKYVWIVDTQNKKIFPGTVDEIQTEKEHIIGDTVAAFYAGSAMTTLVVYR